MKPKIIIKTKGTNFAIVEIVCIDPLVLDPKVFINAINAMTAPETDAVFITLLTLFIDDEKVL